jgi:hypothetical protein
MAGRNFLFVPGPTNIPDRVQRAMVVAMEDHRSSRFPELALSVLAELKKVFKTQTGKTKVSMLSDPYTLGAARSCKPADLSCAPFQAPRHRSVSPFAAHLVGQRPACPERS